MGGKGFSDMKASIIVLTYNGKEYTQECLESIFSHTHLPFELIVVDNASTDGTVEYLKSLSKSHPVKVIYNDTNLGYAGGNNRGVLVAEGDYLVFLNNDVIVTGGWLQRIARHFEQSPQIGAVGPLTNAARGIQRIATKPYKDLDQMHLFASDLAAHFQGKYCYYDRLVGFCLAIRREVIKKVGLFDEQFGLGNFEDDDLCLRIKKGGYKLVIALDVFIHHFQGKTFTINQINYEVLIKKNKAIFKEKWGVLRYLLMKLKASRRLQLSKDFRRLKDFTLKYKNHER